LGQEWAPIKNEFFTPDVFQEFGYTFATINTHNLTHARWYTSPDPIDIALASTPGLGASGTLVFQVSVYPTYTEDLTGPIGRALIPVMSGSVSGTATIQGQSTVQGALANNSANSGYIDFGNGFGTLTVNFNTTGYAGLLSDKRILRVNLVGIVDAPQKSFSWTMDATPQGPGITLGSFDIGEVGGGEFLIPAGEVTPLWSTATTLGEEANELHAWRYLTLERFSTTGPTPRLRVRCSVSSLDDSFMSYLAMEIFYCAETRVAEGAKRVGASVTGGQSYVIGATPVILRGTTFQYPVQITAGDYTVTMNLADFRGNTFFTS
jgi:hypothetical protein